MISGTQYSLKCQNCSFSQLCLPFNLDDSELNKLDEIISRKQPYQKGQSLFQQNDKLKSLYAIRSGSFKSFTVTPDGKEQITAFHLPGEIIGFDGISTEVHETVAQALETSMVCEIPFATLDTLSDSMPALRRQLLKLMSSEIKQDQELLLLLNQRTAEQRLAYFLFSLAKRFDTRGYSGKEYRLTMTRGEIGNYLGLTVETISRLISKLKDDKIISVDGKLITVLDEDALAVKSKVGQPDCR